MKNIYQRPVADLVCFRSAEDLAIDFGAIWDVNGGNATYGKQEGATTSELGDIKVNTKK